MSVYLQQIVPLYQRRNEAAQMHEVRNLFLELQSMILNHQSGEIDIPMSPEATPIFSLSPLPNTLEVRPAYWTKRFMPTDDAYVDQANPNTNYGSDEVLSVQSYKPVGDSSQNRRIYISFDIGSELPGIDSESIVEAWLVLYCENISKFQGLPWDMNPSQFSQYDEFFLPDLPVKVEARQVTGSWDESTITWNNQPAVGDIVTASKWPYEENHTIKDNEAWFTWEVTSWVKDRIEAGQTVDFCLKSPNEDSTQQRYANFSSKERGSLKVIDENEGNSYKVTGHPPYLKPHLTVIYENGDDPGPPTYDNWGALIEDGYLRLELHTYQYPEHDFVFESGAVFQQQWGGAFTMMISDPGLIVGEHVDDDPNDAIVVTVNRYRIVNWDRMVTSSDVRLRVNIKENTDYLIQPTDTDGDGDVDPNRENVMITIVTPYEWPWKYYLRDLTMTWNSSVNQGGLEWWANYYTDPDTGEQGVWSNNVADFQAKLYVDRNTRVYIWGRTEDPSVKDIYYYDHTYDVEVTIGV